MDSAEEADQAREASVGVDAGVGVDAVRAERDGSASTPERSALCPFRSSCESLLSWLSLTSSPVTAGVLRLSSTTASDFAQGILPVQSLRLVRLVQQCLTVRLRPPPTHARRVSRTSSITAQKHRPPARAP